MKDYKFHNVPLTENEKIAIISYAEERDWVFSDVIQTLVERDFKVSFSWSGFNNSVQLSLTTKDDTSPFAGWILCFLHVDVHTLGKIMLWLSAEGLDQIELPKGDNSKVDW